jgi:hypothetical protein
MKLWRINLKPGLSKPGLDVTEFCVEREIMGIGWKVDPTPVSKADYLKRGKECYGGKGKRSWSAAANALLNRMSIGDLIWTRNRKAVYYLGQITGDWRADDSPEHTEADLVNLRSCIWVRVGTMDNVPGAVINAFRPASTIQRVSDPHALEYSRFLFARMRGEPCSTSAKPDVFSLLSADDLEDAVAIYLQVTKRYVMLPSTCKSDTMTVECVLISQDDGIRIGVQVKSGSVSLGRDAYSTFGGMVYLFAASGKYRGEPHPRCVCLEPDVIRKFILENKRLMPGRIQQWIDYIDAVS